MLLEWKRNNLKVKEISSACGIKDIQFKLHLVIVCQDTLKKATVGILVDVKVKVSLLVPEGKILCRQETFGKPYIKTSKQTISIEHYKISKA